jgi:Tol biopolymer transport system component/imidazolonepropionase-like amidohydrolase
VLRRVCVDRRVLAVLAATATVAAQDVATLRDINLTLTEGTSMSAAAAPDRRSIAIDLVGALWVLPIRGGEAKRITPALLEARQPAWSPDSQSIAFQGYDDGAWHVYVINRDGGDARAVTHGEFDDREPAWSHDGSRIAFSSDRYGGISTIWEIVLASGALRRVSARDGSMPTWSPNDDEIAFVSQDSGQGSPTNIRERVPGLWAVNAQGRERLVSDATQHGMPAGAAWNLDGTHLASALAGGHLAINGQQVSGPDEDVFPFRPSWITRSDFVYTADGHIKRQSLDGSTSTIPFTASVPLQRATFSIVHRVLEPVGPQRVAGIVRPAVSPDGRAIAFAALGDLWMLPTGGTPVQITNDAAFDVDPAWSPDSTQLAFASDRRGHMDLWVRDLRTNSDVQVTRERAAVSGPAWSRDGSQIAYLGDRHEVRTVRMKASDCRGGGAAPPTAGDLGRPTWAPGCRSVAVGSLFPYSDRFREGLNHLLLYGFESGSWSQSVLFPQHSAGNRESGGPVWSPNGTHMAFVTEGRLWTVAVDAEGGAIGPPDPIADDQPESPSWEGDSRHIVYQTAKGLRRVLADGSPPDPIAIDLTWRASPAPERIVIHAGHVLDGVLEALHGESDIVVERGIIKSLEAHRDDLHSGAVVDASTDTVMPGLIEMHAHLDEGYGGDFGRLWLAYGITSVRLPSVNPYAALEQREAFESGRRPGPRVFFAGDPFDGRRVFYPGGVAVTSAIQLEQELERASTLGADFFMTDVRLPDRMQKRIVDYAHDQGKPVTSHEIYPAIAFGIDGVEHVRGTSRRGYSPKLSGTNRAYTDVIDLLTKSGVTLTPTLGIQGAFQARATGDKTLLYDRRFALFPLPVVATLADLAGAPPNPALDLAMKPYEAMVKAVFAGGGKILAGTDSPLVPYGLGLHVELESYVHAGLTPYQALQTATMNAAQALGLGDELGTIQPGKIADLAFVSGDPLIDIRATRDVRRVMRGGRVFAVSDLIKR